LFDLKQAHTRRRRRRRRRFHLCAADFPGRRAAAADPKPPARRRRLNDAGAGLYLGERYRFDATVTTSAESWK